MLAGVYFDNSGSPRVVTIRGYHHAGNKTEIGPRQSYAFASGIKPWLASTRPRRGRGGSHARSRPGEPCDEQPPDEDVLCEDDVTDPTATTPSPDPPYDGGA